MGLKEMLGLDGIDLEKIEQNALETKKTQEDVLLELRKISGQLGIIVYAVEKWISNQPKT